jgi:hypothetical protein
LNESLKRSDRKTLETFKMAESSKRGVLKEAADPGKRKELKAGKDWRNAEAVIPAVGRKTEETARACEAKKITDGVPVARGE